MADVAQRFFCHECSIEIPRIAADFTCPTCNSGKCYDVMLSICLKINWYGSNILY